MRTPATEHAKQGKEAGQDHGEMDLTATHMFCEQRELMVAEAGGQTCRRKNPQEAVGRSKSAKN